MTDNPNGFGFKAARGGWETYYEPYNQAALDAFNAKWGCSLKRTCHACPVQIEGPLADGRYLYFRERWGEWAIGVGENEDDALYISAYKPTAEGDHNGTPGGASIFQALAEIDKVLEAQS